MAIKEYVVLVDEMDNEIGTMEKMEAHLQPNLHRAFSIFIFNKKGEMLLQQRAVEKYHSGGLWTNACCSHPQKNESVLSAAHRRLKEEMGFDTELNKVFDFIYQASFSNGLNEYEFDHVFVGHYDGDLSINALEVANYCFKSMADLNDELINYPDIYTEWFKIALPNLKAHLQHLDT